MLSACGIPTASSGPISSPDPDTVQSIIVNTAAAAQTQTAAVASPTSSPTYTPTVTPLPTGTMPPTPELFVYSTSTPPVLLGSGDDANGIGEILPTATKGPEIHNYKGTLDCAWVGQSPSDGTVFKPRQKFTVVWTIKNTGTAAWKRHTIDYRYLGGDKFHDKKSRYDMNYILDPGETIDIKVDMHAPKTSGSYETTWVVGLNTEVLCKMTLAIVVR